MRMVDANLGWASWVSAIPLPFALYLGKLVGQVFRISDLKLEPSIILKISLK